MRESRGDWTLIASEVGRPVGLLTERDLVQIIATSDVNGSVGEAARKPLLMVDAGYDLLRAWDLMSRSKIRHLVVLDGSGEVRGVLCFRDLLEFAVGQGLACTGDEVSPQSANGRRSPGDGPITRNHRRIPPSLVEIVEEYVDLDFDLDMSVDGSEGADPGAHG
jgi:CBS domain containing-hemolysin-like protein